MGGEASTLNHNNNNNVNNKGRDLTPMEREQMIKMQRHMEAKKKAELEKRKRANTLAGRVHRTNNLEHNRVMGDVIRTQNRINGFQFSSSDMRHMVNNGNERNYDRMNVSTRKPIYKDRPQPTLQVHHKEGKGDKRSNGQKRKINRNAEISKSINNMDDFEESEKRLEEEFQRGEMERRRKFQKDKEKRRKAFTGEINKFKRSKFDPYKILSLPKNFTMDQLKRSYKKMAMKTHPDKGGDPRVFKVITKSYLTLVDELKKRENNNTYGDLKKNADSFLGSQSTEAPTTLNDSNGFNINKFNTLYSEHRMDRPEDAGYGKWMEGTDFDETSQKPLFSDGFNLDVFNSVFNDEVNEGVSNEVIQYHKPNALISGSGIACVELGRGRIKDFSSDGTSSILGRSSKKSLQFTDYKLAHTKTTITGVKSDREDFNSIGDLKMNRQNISYKMSREERDREAQIKKRNEERERRRIERLENHDRMAAEHFNRVRNVITGRPMNNSDRTLSITNSRERF